MRKEDVKITEKYPSLSSSNVLTKDEMDDALGGDCKNGCRENCKEGCSSGNRNGTVSPSTPTPTQPSTLQTGNQDNQTIG